MNADNDVERLIAGWLHETATPRAPDRVLETVAGSIDATRQRPRAAWREHMSWSLPKLLAAGVAVVAIALGAGLVGRSTAGIGAPSPTPGVSSSSPTPAATAASIAEYRLARNRICAAAQPTKDAVVERYARVYESDVSDAERADGIAAMREFIQLADDVTDDLAALEPPAEIADAHVANVTRLRGMAALLRHVVRLLEAGDVDDALAVDLSTDALLADEEAFERLNQLTPCL